MARTAGGHQFLDNAKELLTNDRTVQELRQAHAVVLPLEYNMFIVCMQIFLDEVASRYPKDRIVMVTDGAGWHRSELLIIPDNMRLVKLPPYSPEHNPVEHIWDELREKSFHNRVFKSIEVLEDHLSSALLEMELDNKRVHSIVAWPWIINALMY